MPMTFALFSMPRSLQEEFRPYYRNLQCMWKRVSNSACASKYPPLPFEYSFPIRNKRSLLPLFRDITTLEMIPCGLLFAANIPYFV